MTRPVHFEFSILDAERAATFYGKVFGWSFQKWDGPMPYWMVTTGPEGEPGINGGVMIREAGMNPGTANVMGVQSVDAAVEAIKAAGGEIVLAKTAIPGMGWVAYANDTESNLFGVFQEDPAAK